MISEVVTSPITGCQHLDVFATKYDQQHRHPVLCATRHGVRIATWAAPDTIPPELHDLARSVHRALAADRAASVSTIEYLHRRSI